MNEFEGLSKKERKKLKKLLEQKEQMRTTKNNKLSNYFLIGILTVIAISGIIWFSKQPAKQSPGQNLPDQGREHSKPPSNFTYNSNPPTSGPHDPEWIKSGLYNSPQEEGKLIHSLEHGYVIISYNCDWQAKSQSGLTFPKVLAHEENETATSSAYESSNSAHLDLVKWKDNKDCQDLVNKLETIGKNRSWKKIIVVPRPVLDNRIALTAWTKLDKFTDYDENRILSFISAYYDRGPEKTME